MEDKDKTREELVTELAEMRQRIAELEASESEHKKVEEALKEGEKTYRELADLLPQVVFEMDLEGNITFMNRNGLEFLGYTQEDLEAGLAALQLVIPEDRERIGQNLQRTFAGERTGGIQLQGSLCYQRRKLAQHAWCRAMTTQSLQPCNALVSTYAPPFAGTVQRTGKLPGQINQPSSSQLSTIDGLALGDC
jgi:hypothetical protein